MDLILLHCRYNENHIPPASLFLFIFNPHQHYSVLETSSAPAQIALQRKRFTKPHHGRLQPREKVRREGVRKRICTASLRIHFLIPLTISKFNDGREVGLLHFVYNHDDLANIRNSPQQVLDAIDEYGRSKKYLMVIGYHKGDFIKKIFAERRPATVVELGGYVGYSTVAFGAATRDNGGGQYLSLEENPEFAAVSSSLCDLAGLSDTVKVVVGSSDKSLRRLHAEGVLKHIDLLFLDHLKPLYTRDLKICESLGLITEGTVIVADNVVRPGNSPYLEYVNATVAEKQEKAKNENSDGLEPGNPHMIYESHTIPGFQMSGLMVRLSLLISPFFAALMRSYRMALK